jgi:hypothetical protein
VAKKAAGKGNGKRADQYMLRFPDGMREAIAKRASKSGRSINTEIISALEQFLAGADRADALLDLVEANRENIAKLAGLYFVVDELNAQLNNPKIKW